MSNRDTMHPLSGMHEVAIPFRQAEKKFRTAFRAKHRRQDIPELSMALSDYCTNYDRWTLMTRDGLPVALVSAHGQVVLVDGET